MSDGTATTTTTEVSPEALLRAMREIKFLEPLQWTLVAPDGRLFQGTQQEVARVLLQNIDVTQLFKDTP